LATKASYNEQVKLSASLINLMAVGVITTGVTAPLVGLLYGSHMFDDISMSKVTLSVLYLFALAFGLHLAALLTLRSVIE